MSAMDGFLELVWAMNHGVRTLELSFKNNPARNRFLDMLENVNRPITTESHHSTLTLTIRQPKALWKKSMLPAGAVGRVDNE